jgi:ankyrin repeat protein
MEDKAIVKLLEKGNIFIDSRDDSGRTPLSLAAWKGHEAVVKLLLDTVIGILKKISEVAILHVREFESII